MKTSLIPFDGGYRIQHEYSIDEFNYLLSIKTSDEFVAKFHDAIAHLKNLNSDNVGLFDWGDVIPTPFLPIPGLAKDFCITGCGSSGNVTVRANGITSAFSEAVIRCNGSFGPINEGACG